MFILYSVLGALAYRLQGIIKLWGDLLWGLSIAILSGYLFGSWWIILPVFLIEGFVNQQWPHGNRYDIGAMPWKTRRDSFLTKDLPNTTRGDLIAMARIGCMRGIALGSALWIAAPAALPVLTVMSTLAFPIAYYLGKQFPFNNIPYLDGPTKRAEAYLGLYHFLTLSLLS